MKRLFLPTPALLLLTLACCLAAGATAAVANERPNVLLIILEDNNPAVWGCYGAEAAHTPNVDRLAASGVRFDRAYCQATSCNPSRTSFLTGRRPESTRVAANPHNPAKLLPAGIPSLPEVFHGAGFFTVDIGKVFHSTEFAPRQLMAFDVIEHFPAPLGWKGPPPLLMFPPAATSTARLPDPILASDDARTRQRKLSDRYGDDGLPIESTKDRRMARTAVAHLSKLAQAKQPFFMTLGLTTTHTPLLAPAEFLKRHPVESEPLPQGWDTPVATTRYHQRVSTGNPDLFTRSPASAEQARAALAAYRACMSFADSNIGIILDELRRTSLEKNTVIILMGDHGFHLGDHGLWSKYTLLEATRRVPLLIHAPGVAGNGRASASFVELIDLFPTLCELCAIPAPSALEGRSLVPLLRDPAQHSKDAIFTTDQDGSRCVRTDRWSFMQWKDGTTALFDLKSDPWETQNLAAENPSQAATMAKLFQTTATSSKRQ